MIYDHQEYIVFNTSIRIHMEKAPKYYNVVKFSVELKDGSRVQQSAWIVTNATPITIKRAQKYIDQYALNAHIHEIESNLVNTNA